MEFGDIEERVERARDELKNLLRDQKISQRAVETRCGWSRGYLSQVFQGRITLTLAHVLAILDAAETSAVEFFQSLDDAPNPLLLDEIRNRLEQYDAQFDELRRKGLLGPEPWKGKVGQDS